MVKPDQLIKRRGKLGLVGVNLDLKGVREWLKSRLMKETTVCFPAAPCLASVRTAGHSFSQSCPPAAAAAAPSTLGSAFAAF